MNDRTVGGIMAMQTMLVRNRVEDFDRWKKVFDEQRAAALEAGLRCTRMWREAHDPDNVFFLFQMADPDRARAYLESPESSEVGRAAGVLDGEAYFLDEVDGY